MTLASSSVGGLWRRFKGTLLDSATLDLGSLPFDKFGGVKFIVNIKNTANDLYYQAEIGASRANGGEINNTDYALVGDFPQIELEVVRDGAEVLLRLTNSTTLDWAVVASRLKTS